MSLFGSLYDDDQPVDAPSERAHDAAVGDVPVPVETPTPTEVPPQPAALDDGEFPNLHAFADAAFGVAGGALDASPVAWDVASARAELSSFMAPSVLAEASSRPAPLTAPAAAGEASAQPAAESAQPAAAKAPVEASALPDPVDLDPAPESDEPEPEAPETSIPALAEQALALNDDFLPSHRPRLDVSLGGDSPTWTLKNVAVVVLAALVGFGAYKIAFSSASGDDAPTVELHDVDQADPSAPDDVVPQTPGALKDAAADAGARLDLQRATVAAASVYAERGSFELTFDEWSAQEPSITFVSGGSAAPAAGSVLVWSDADAACFETLSASGTVLAAAVTPDGPRYSSGPAGGLCSLDPAAVAAWSATL